MSWRDGIPDTLVSGYIMLERFDEAANLLPVGVCLGVLH